jgi:acetylornithine deacetylase/succinyl-diaminopimelate desuccinylase-like protein
MSNNSCEDEHQGFQTWVQTNFVLQGMLFIPCFKGYSHRPDEFSTPKQLQSGVKVLAVTLARLAMDDFRAETPREEL